jgi:HAD superfamily hydrolase (TIGR01549 family)
MRAVLFDFGGTLDFPRHWLDRFYIHYHDAGVPLTRSQLDQAFSAATRAAYRSAALLRNHRLIDLIRWLVRRQLECLRHLESSRKPSVVAPLHPGFARETLVDRISEAFIQESMAGLAHSREILATLAVRFKIGVVSNFYGNLERILEDAGFAPIVAAIADSGCLGIYKPDPEIYRTVLGMLAVAPAVTTMVGDSLDKDCAPARELGMRTVWLRHREASLENARAQDHADFTITALEELNQLLCRIC